MLKSDKRGWHWPQFEKILCGQMSERELLGLPDHFAPARFSDILPTIYREIRSTNAQGCVAMAEDKSLALPYRLAAANLLALTGDPRISTLDPAMVFFKGGEAEIGLDESQVDDILDRFGNLGIDRKWIVKECPRHRVQLRDFRIGKYPVTNQEYRDFLIDTQHADIPTSWSFRAFPLEKSNHPVYTVNVSSAEAYTAWLSGKTGRKFRLPSEAEWEYAAAGPDGLEFPWGNDYEPDFANTAETGLFSSSPVGIFVEGNSLSGVADLAGNIEEYVSDDYAAYPGGVFVADHLVDMNGAYRVARGGSFARFRDLARTRRRHGHNPASHTYAMGFRLVEELGD